MASNTFPVNEVRCLMDIPKIIPLIGFLGGEAGKEIAKSIRMDYKDIPALQIGKYSNGVVMGSNPFWVSAVQDKLPSGIRVASQADLEKAMRVNALDFNGTYEDTGLVLRTTGNPNFYLSCKLFSQINTRFGKRKRIPAMIPFFGTALERDQDSPEGLSFKLKEDAEAIYAPILNKPSGPFSSGDINPKTGLPKRLNNGDRKVYTINSGLSRLFLYRYLDLYSNYVSLAYSNDTGRVVLVSTAEGSSQEYFQEYAQRKHEELRRERDAQIEPINKRYAIAEKILKGN